MDYYGSEMTYRDAHRRIYDAEQGIANGNVVLHSDVMKHSYEVLNRMEESYRV